MSLPDLNQDNDFVASFLEQWASEIVANYSGKTPTIIVWDATDKGS